jgi:hypothetical protein
MKDASAFDTRLGCIRLPFNFWWESLRPHAVLASAGERPADHIFVGPAFLGASQLIRLNLGRLSWVSGTVGRESPAGLWLN